MRPQPENFISIKDYEEVLSEWRNRKIEKVVNMLKGAGGTFNGEFRICFKGGDIVSIGKSEDIKV